MNLANPWFSILFLIPISLCFFYVWVYHKNNQALAEFAQKNLFNKIIDWSGQQIRTTNWIIRLTVFLFITLALIGPEWGYQWQQVTRKGSEIIFALDTSKSMLATDLKPSRLEKAKLAIKDLLNLLPGDKVGLIAFSGTSFLQCPLTLDYSAFNISLDSLNIMSIPRGGTAIGEAINTARNAFKSDNSSSKILILITDGENHEGNPITATKDAAKEGITIYTIGAGTPEGELVVVTDQNGNSSYLKDEQGNVVKSTLNETVLQEIAKESGGTYCRGTGISMGLIELYTKKINKLSKAELTSKWQKSYLDHYQIPLMIAVILLFFEIIYGKAYKTISFFQKELSATNKVPS